MSEIAFLKLILSDILKNPDKILISKEVDSFGTLLKLEVSKSDLPIVIGTKGKNIASIRTIMRMFGNKHNQRINIKIIDNN